jgi:hypothetical protein
MKILSACGRVCLDCPTHMRGCLGCYHTRQVKLMKPEVDMCPIYKCVMSKYETRLCSDCPSLPCALYSICINPTLSDYENELDIKKRAELLKRFR